jgi:hypothetical protein
MSFPNPESVEHVVICLTPNIGVIRKYLMWKSNRSLGFWLSWLDKQRQSSYFLSQQFVNHGERREGSGPSTARQPDHQGAKSSPKDGKHEVAIDKMVVQTSPVDAVRGFLI